MATQTTIQQQLPPGYVTGIGEQFSDYFMGMPANTLSGSPFFADPNQMFGGSFNPSTGQFTGITGANVPASDFFVAGQDAMQTDAQAIATGQQTAPTGGLGQYQQYVNQANALQDAAMGTLGTTNPITGAFTPNQAAGTQALADAASTVADADAAATAGQNAATPFLQQAQQFAGPQGYLPIYVSVSTTSN